MLDPKLLGIDHRLILAFSTVVLFCPAVLFACQSDPSDQSETVGAPDVGRVSQSPPIYRGDSVALEYDDVALANAVAQATRLWSTCAQYAVGFPRFIDRGPADRILHLRLEKTSPNKRCGSFAGSSIVLYRFSRRSSGALSDCGSLGQNLAHELGHALGLEDRERRERTNIWIMSRIDPLNRFTREVHGEECSSVDLKWQTQAEGGPSPRPTVSVRATL